MENTYGWQGKILRLNLTSGDTQHQSIEDMAEQFIGGRGFLTKIYWDEVDTKTDALHPDSPIIIMTGPLAGTSTPSCNRWFIGGKSPLLNPEQFGNGTHVLGQRRVFWRRVVHGSPRLLRHLQPECYQ